MLGILLEMTRQNFRPSPKILSFDNNCCGFGATTTSKSQVDVDTSAEHEILQTFRKMFRRNAFSIHGDYRCIIHKRLCFMRCAHAQSLVVDQIGNGEILALAQ